MTDKNVSVLTSGSYTGSQTVREFEVTDLKVENGKLNGNAVGSVRKEGTGVVDKVRLSFTDVPFEGVGGGGDSDIVYVTVEAGAEVVDQSIPVTSCDKTKDEITDAIMSNKTLIGRVVFSDYTDPSNYSIEVEPFIFRTKLEVYEQHIGWYIYANKMDLLDLPTSKQINNMQLVWTSEDELPTLNVLTATLNQTTSESEDFG